MTQTRAARILGVRREYLNRVLHGRQQSARLLRLYGELVSPRAAEPQAGQHKTNEE